MVVVATYGRGKGVQRNCLVSNGIQPFSGRQRKLVIDDLGIGGYSKGRDSSIGLSNT